MSSFTWYRDKDGQTIRCLETGVAYVKSDPHWDIVPLDPDDDDNVVEGEDIPHVWNLLESLCEKEVGNDPAQETVSPREYRYFRFRLEESEKARQQALRSNAEMMEDLDRAKQELAQLRVERDNLARDVEMLGLADNEYIRWHPYPEVVPEFNVVRTVLVTLNKVHHRVIPAIWCPSQEIFQSLESHSPINVIAWAHLPAGYNPKEDKDNE